MVPSFYQTVDTGIISLIKPAPWFSQRPSLLFFFTAPVRLFFFVLKLLIFDWACRSPEWILHIKKGRYEDLYKKKGKE